MSLTQYQRLSTELSSYQRRSSCPHLKTLTFHNPLQVDVRQRDIGQGYIGTHVDRVTVTSRVAASNSVAVAVTGSCCVSIAIAVPVVVTVAQEAVPAAGSGVGYGAEGVGDGAKGLQEATLEVDGVVIACLIFVAGLVVVSIVVAGFVVVAVVVAVAHAVADEGVSAARGGVCDGADGVVKLQAR
jgi:hypothetical protein